MKSPFLDLMRPPFSAPTNFVKLLQEQQLDTVETSVKALSVRDPMALVTLQQAFMQRMIERWTKNGAAVEKAATETAAKPAKAAAAKPAPKAKTTPKLVAAPAPVAEAPKPAEAVPPKKAKPVIDTERADDLTVIKGIGPKFAKTLNENGIWSYRQLASLTGAEVEALEEKLGFSGRFERENWIEQARALAH